MTIPPLFRRRDARWRSVALAALIAAGAAGAADPKAARFYEDALTRYDKQDYAGAIVQLKNALQVDREMLSVHVLLGKALLANSEVGAAEVALNEALRLGVNRAEVVVPMAQAAIAQGKQQQVVEQPRFALAGLPPQAQRPLLLLRGAAYSDLGDTRSALKAIEEARSLDPVPADSWLAEVPVRIRAHQLAEANDAASKALAIAPESADGWYYRASIAHVRTDIPAALAAYDRTLRIRPEHLEALIARAGIYLDLNRPADAARDVAVLAKLAPKEPRAAYLRALLAEREGNSAAARAAMQEVTNLLDPVPAEFLRYRPQLQLLAGLSHYGLGQRDKAKPYLEAAQRAQANAAVSKLLAQIYLAENNVDRAIESLELYLKAEPGDVQALTMLASAHMAQGRHARATKLMQDALRSKESPQLRTALGLSLLRAGRLAEAQTELEAAYRKDPSLTQAGGALVNLYLKAGVPAKAVQVADALVARQPTDASLLNMQGQARNAAGDAAGARRAFEQAARIDDKYIAARVNLARLDIAARAYDAATKRLLEALTLDDKNVDALSEMGVVAERRGQLVEAQRWLEKAADHSGRSELQPSIALVDFHLRGGRNAAALEATKRLTTKAPDDVLGLIATARAYLANANPEAARANLSRATRVAEYDAPLQVQIALLQMSAGNLPGAAYSLDKALSGSPDFLPAQATLADVEIRMGDVAKAELRARQIIAKNPKLAVGHSLLGAVAAARNQGPAAVESYRRAYQLEPGTDSLLRLYHVMAVADSAGALRLADQWLQQHPQDRLVRKAVGDTQARARNFPAARIAYEAVVKAAPNDIEAMNNLASVLLMLKDPGALKLADRALALQPNNPNVIDTAGWASYQAGNKERALQLLRDARLRDPGNPSIRFHLASVLAEGGRRTEAREELEAALKAGRAFSDEKDARALLGTLR